MNRKIIILCGALAMLSSCSGLSNCGAQAYGLGNGETGVFGYVNGEELRSTYYGSAEAADGAARTITRTVCGNLPKEGR